MDEITIRVFERSDTEAVIALWQRCELIVPWNDPNKDIARKLGVQPDNFLVGTLGGEIVASAMAGYDGHRGWIFYLAVDPQHRNSGHGRRMVAACETRLRAMGCPKINVQLREANPDAVGFYQAIGFERDAVIGLGKRLEPDD